MDRKPPPQDPRTGRDPETSRKRSGGTPASENRVASAQQAVGGFLRATRTAQKLTQEQVARMTRATPWRLSRAAISAIERGQNFPGMEAMLALSNVLFVDPKELIERARLSTAVPVDLTDLDLDALDARARDRFWAGDFRQALSIYDAMLERLALEPQDDPAAVAERVAALEIRRATALKRAGALLSAIATCERAISLSVDSPRQHAEAYVVLADLQCQRGHLPLAGDAASRAVELAGRTDVRVQGWAWMVRAHVHFLAHEYEEAEQAFLEARARAERAGDTQHLTHIEGDIGMCCRARGKLDEAREWVERAITRARHQAQPALEASWLVELGKIDFEEGRSEQADRHAKDALRIAEPNEHLLTVFRAEWLRHGIAERTRPGQANPERLARLRELFLLLDQHEGIEEVQSYKRNVLRVVKGGR